MDWSKSLSLGKNASTLLTGTVHLGTRELPLTEAVHLVDIFVRKLQKVSGKVRGVASGVKVERTKASTSSLLFYFNFERLRKAGTGHESLTII
ncbi:MAG: hypothetical protein RLZZ234_504, partial [Candidatus Parcubacteria bacterium]